MTISWAFQVLLFLYLGFHKQCLWAVRGNRTGSHWWVPISMFSLLQNTYFLRFDFKCQVFQFPPSLHILQYSVSWQTKKRAPWHWSRHWDLFSKNKNFGVSGFSMAKKEDFITEAILPSRFCKATAGLQLDTHFYTFSKQRLSIAHLSVMGWEYKRSLLAN